MKSFKLESKQEREERAKNSIWNIENFKYKNITKELAENYIKEYWIAGIIMLAISIMFYLFQGQVNSFLYDIILMVLMIFGVYKKIRWVGVVFFIYFLIGKAILFIDNPQYINIGTIIVSLVFFRSFYLGMLSLFKLYSLNKKTIAN